MIFAFRHITKMLNLIFKLTIIFKYFLAYYHFELFCILYLYIWFIFPMDNISIFYFSYQFTSRIYMNYLAMLCVSSVASVVTSANFMWQKHIPEQWLAPNGILPNIYFLFDVNMLINSFS